jgi:hypothetical protein
MSERWWLWVGTLSGLTLLGGAGVVLVAPPWDTLTKENVAKVKNGMTLAEVEAIFGRPADDRHDVISWRSKYWSGSILLWCGYKDAVLVGLTWDGRVSATELRPGDGMSLLKRIRARLGW